jgi:type IV secretory pathway VirD2 relaxase
MSGRDDDDFRPRPGASKQRGDAFINQVLRQASKAGGKLGKSGQRPGSRLGRGHAAARFADRRLGRNARRVTIKTRLVNLTQAGSRSVAAHLRYIERDGVDRQGGPGRAYGPTTDEADLEAFKERSEGDRHQFRFIVSPEDAAELEDLRTYTRHLMARMASDLGTELEWIAVDHWNTDNPHTHVVLRGKDDTGHDLIISRDYISKGMRDRACELATEWLGPRTELEIRQSMAREIEQDRWTELDRALQREVQSVGRVKVGRLYLSMREPLIGRLQYLQRMGLAREKEAGEWTVHPNAERTLRAMGERGDIVRTMQRAMGGQQRELAVFVPDNHHHTLVGRVAGKGLADELNDQGYLVIDGIDGKAHYVTLPPKAELAQYPVNAVVEIKGSPDVRAADKNIVALAADGIYSADRHLAVARAQAKQGRDPQEVVAAHVRRLEALRRAGIVERVGEGLWKVPDDLPERGQQHDTRRTSGVGVELKTHLSIERQVRAIGATWLDQQLIGGGAGLGDLGFGSETKEALQKRADFLAEQGLAERRGQRVILARNLLGTLRNRELAQAAKDMTSETGLEHRPVAEGQRVTGIYRRSVVLASGRYAVLDDGLGFRLVPWRPVIESKLGQQITAVMHGNSVSWSLGRTRGR